MRRPTQVLLWMIPFLGLVGLTVALLITPLTAAFNSNPVFNGVIIGVFLIGILINFRQVGMLSREVAWVNDFRDRGGRYKRKAPRAPRLLAALAKMLSQHEKGALHLSPMFLRSLLDSVRLRLDETRDISRYMIGLLIFLGLLGTFWGLLVTVRSVGLMVGELGGHNADSLAMFGSLMEGLRGPLSGMGTAFSSSLFGLAGSLVLGFLDLQAGHAQNRFFNELEDWLTSATRVSGGLGGFDRELGEPAYIHAMLEQTAETLDKLQRNIARDEEQRRLIGEQILSLSRNLSTFVELARDERNLSETRTGIEESMQGQIHSLDTNIRRLTEELASGREHLTDEVRDELRLIGRALSAEVHNRARSRRQEKSAG